MSDLIFRDYVVLRAFFQYGDLSTSELISKIWFDTAVTKTIIKKMYHLGFLTMIRVDRKFPYQLTEPGREYVDKRTRISEGVYYHKSI